MRRILFLAFAAVWLIGCPQVQAQSGENRIFSIVTDGSPVLRAECMPVEADYPRLNELVRDMFFTMADAEGVGLAAPQIGLSIRLFVIDCTPWSDEYPELADCRKVFINPEIYHYSEQTMLRTEGCLSFPDLRVCVPRACSVRMRYLDSNFVAHDEEFSGVEAWVIQHEYDHIEGVLFIDRGVADQK